MAGGLSTAIDEVLALDPDGLDDAALDAKLLEVHRQADRLEAAKAQLTSAWDRRGVWREDGSKAAGARLARDTGCAPLRACREVNRARKLRTMPLTAAAFAAGALSLDHVDELANANHPDVADVFARDEELLVSEGGRLGSFRHFHRLVRHWRNCADDQASEQRADRQHHNRYFRGAKTMNGVVDLQGRTDAIPGAIILGELERLERQLWAEDWAAARAEHGLDARPHHLARTTAQRMADALELMARRSAAMVPDARPARPLITVLVGYETFKGRVCELADGTVLTPGQVASLLTEADIERIVFDTPSRVIDVGAKTRFYRGATRRAIEVRDQFCYSPAATTPPTGASATTSSKTATAAKPPRTTAASPAAPTTANAPAAPARTKTTAPDAPRLRRGRTLRQETGDHGWRSAATRVWRSQRSCRARDQPRTRRNWSATSGEATVHSRSTAPSQPRSARRAVGSIMSMIRR
ncbi:MAG: endonuclease [Acidimicrobiales bacterium]|nr:endonuclease [Acidimicrobiales bacterium]